MSEIETIEVRAPLQSLNQQTRSLHAAAFLACGGRIRIGQRGCRPAQCARQTRRGGFRRWALGTRRSCAADQPWSSVEKVQKTAVIGVPFVIAMSPPTTLAIGTAEGAGITLLAMMDTAYSRTRIASFWPDDRRGKPLVDR